jgi:tRNA isopentenyl-2-thiomethyl-A-37 hydroxylase MiaE
LRDEFSHFCINTKKFEYNNEHFVDVTPEDFDKAFVEWINSYPNLPMDKKVLLDYMEARKAEAAARKAVAPANR